MLLGTAALLPSVSRGQQSLPFASAWKTLRTPKAVPLGREVGWAELRGAWGATNPAASLTAVVTPT